MIWMAHDRFKADVMHRSSDLLIPVIEDGIRVLIYAGVNDLMCNFIGNEVSRTCLPSAPSVTLIVGYLCDHTALGRQTRDDLPSRLLEFDRHPLHLLQQDRGWVRQVGRSRSRKHCVHGHLRGWTHGEFLHDLLFPSLLCKRGSDRGWGCDMTGPARSALGRAQHAGQVVEQRAFGFGQVDVHLSR
jgi:hypothetical protein